ncbi:hypothetical protein HHK36_004557 [Tetracentron sinense]|uniref:Uncharacterized protein n=1 Tax=Tetracentron sinense TaxID=13715 RepID=A0A834ZVG7_TETSI|nr:hypothetical protein HHK36_004557 [Tetracentron sinense]
MVAKQIMKELSDMLLTDKVLQYAVLPEAPLGADHYLSSLTTISDVKVSTDLQVVKVYVFVFGDERGKEVALAGLKAKAKYVRGELGKRMKLRLTPEIRFIEDESLEIKNEKKNADGEDEGQSDLPQDHKDQDADDPDEGIIYMNVKSEDTSVPVEEKCNQTLSYRNYILVINKNLGFKLRALIVEIGTLGLSLYSGTARMSVDPRAPSTFVQDDASSDAGEDVNMLDGHNKRQSVTPSSSSRRKRNRKSTGDAIADAMLEIAAASKLRATAMMKNDDRFSISKCVKVLDEMQAVDQHLYFLALDLFENPNARETFISLKSERRLTWLQGKCSGPSNILAGMDDSDIELDEMELVAAAAGYYYYSHISKQPCREELHDLDDQPDTQFASMAQEQVASSLRDSIAAAMWNDFINEWGEW